MAALIGVLVSPRAASATPFTWTCTPSSVSLPPGWFGGPWARPLKLLVDLDGKLVQLLDDDNNVLVGTDRVANLAGLAGYEYDMVINESVINWGIVKMWGFSGYIDRRNRRVDVIWANRLGYSPPTLIRQFHGTCRQS